MDMNPIPGRFTRVARFASSFRPSRSSSITPTHRSFRLTRPAKEKMMGRAVGPYMPQTTKKELKTLEEQITHAVGRGDKTFTDAHGVEHKISDEMRYFAKEAQQSGHTLTKQSEVKKFAEGFVEIAREEDIRLRSGYNIGSEREVAGKIVKAEEASLGSNEHHSAQQERHAKLQERNARLARIGVRPNSMAARPLGETPTGSIQEVQPLTPGTAPAKPPTTNRPLNFMNTGIVAGRHTDTSNHVDNPVVVAPTSDPIAEENQSVAESIPPAQPVDLPDTSNVDRGLPF